MESTSGVQFGWGGGMEHQTATFVVSSEEGLTAHELGHQWFGDKVTCGSWEDIWLNEGFASHLASFYVENKYPASILTNRKNEINFITSQPGGSVKVDDTSNVGRIFDSRLSYNKGSHLIYMLRFKLGDAVFFKGIQQYLKDPALAYGYARTTDVNPVVVVPPAGLNQQHAFGGISAEAVGQQATRRTGADDDVVEFCVAHG